MPGSLIYSPSGSEGGRSRSGVGADLDNSLAGVALITTPRTTPLASRKRGGIENAESVEAHTVVAKETEQRYGGRPPPKTVCSRNDSASSDSNRRYESLELEETPGRHERRAISSVASTPPRVDSARLPSNSVRLLSKSADEDLSLLGSSQACVEAVTIGLGGARRQSVPENGKGDRTLDLDQSGNDSNSREDHPDGHISPHPITASATFEAQSDSTHETRKPSTDHRRDDIVQGECGRDSTVSESECSTHPVIEEGARDQTASAREAHEASDVLHKDSGADADVRGEPTSVRKEGDGSPEWSDNEEGSPPTHVENTQSRPHADRRRSSADHSQKAENGDGAPPGAEATRDLTARDKETPLDSSEIASNAYGTENTMTNHPLFDRSEQTGPDTNNVKPLSILRQPAERGGIRGDLCADGGSVEGRRDHANGDAGAGDNDTVGNRLVRPTDVDKAESGNRNNSDSRECYDLAADREPQSPPAMSRRSRASSRHMTASPDSWRGQKKAHVHEASMGMGTSLQSPPPSTPSRGRNPTESRKPPHISPPLSPVAVAARVISLEESVISTARMKQAAEAIAREDRRRSMTRFADETRVVLRESDWCQERSDEDNEGLDGKLHEQDAEPQIRRPSRLDRAEALEERRLRSLRAKAARRDAEIERDRALELTLEVLKRKHGQRGGGSGDDANLARLRVASPPRRSKRPEDHRSGLAKRVKDSAARSCGLSQTQLVLLRRSRELGKTKDSDRTNNSRDKASKFTQHRRDVLAQPKDDRPATRVRHPATEPLLEELTRRMSDREKHAFLHACLADAKECTHRPHTRTSRRPGGGGGGGGGHGEEGAGDGEGTGAKEAFLYRIDAQERAKTAAMKHRRGELAYKATLDKRVCPQCGAEQSYDEVQEKRKICPTCEVEYRKPRTWTGVRKEFFKRVAQSEESKQAALDAAVAKQEQERERWQEDGVFWEDVEDDFMNRLHEDALRRQLSLQSRSKSLHPDWTFQPKVSPASERFVEESPWSGMTFLERVEGDLQRRREASTYGGLDYANNASGYTFGSYNLNS